MIFGSPDSFAIEAELLEIYGKWTYGRLKFWVRGVDLGNFDDTSDLATSARWGRTFLGASSRRTRSDLDDLPTAEVYDLLYGRFVVAIIDANMPAITPPTEALDDIPYNLDGVGESSLRDKFVLLVVRRGDGRDRIIVRSFADDHISETLLPFGFWPLQVTRNGAARTARICGVRLRRPARPPTLPRPRPIGAGNPVNLSCPRLSVLLIMSYLACVGMLSTCRLLDCSPRSGRKNRHPYASLIRSG